MTTCSPASLPLSCWFLKVLPTRYWPAYHRNLGLYASILPPVLYALFGTSRTLSVGPVSIAAIMIASALTAPEVSALGNPVQSALILSAESGLIMLLMALLRMGGLVNFISHPVLTGFTSGASILIIANQLPLTSSA